MQTTLQSIEKQSIQKKISKDQLDLLYQHILLAVSGSFICSILIFTSLYQLDRSYHVLLWFFAVIVTILYRIFIFFLYRYHYYKYDDDFYLTLFIIGSIAASILWGIAGSLLMPANEYLHQMMVVVILAGITAGSVQALQSNLVVCHTFLFITLLPITIWLYLQHGKNYFILAISMTTYLWFVLLLSLRGYKLLINKLELYYENIDLLEKLSKSNKQLQHSYESLAISEDRFQALLLHSPVVTSIVDTNGKYIAANEPLCHYLGYTQEELLTKTFQQLTYPEDLPKEMELMDELVSGKIPYFQMDKRHIHKDGHLIWTLVTVIAAKSPNGKQELLAQYQDISERKHSEATMVKLNETLQNALSELKVREQEEALMNKMNNALQVCHSSLEAYPRITLFAKQLFPTLSGALAIVKGDTEVVQVIEEWGDKQIMKLSFSINDCFGIRSSNVYLLQNGKDDIPCLHYETKPIGGQICLPLIIQNKTIGVICFYSVSEENITQSQQELALIFANTVKLTLANLRLRELLQECSIHDPLTGLYNRRYLDESMPQELQRALRNQTKLFVAMFDLDFFKKFNDNFGHEAGDEVLKFIGNIFKKKFRGSDIACRYGGEEFLIYLSDNSIENVIARLQQIRNDIKHAAIFYNHQQLPSITISIGVSYAPDHGISTNELILAADQALYRAKNLGRDRVEVYHSMHSTK